MHCQARTERTASTQPMDGRTTLPSTQRRGTRSGWYTEISEGPSLQWQGGKSMAGTPLEPAVRALMVPF
jgi:hypothetical protein